MQREHSEGWVKGNYTDVKSSKSAALMHKMQSVLAINIFKTPWGTIGHSACKEIRQLLCNPKNHYDVHKSPPLDPVLREIVLELAFILRNLIRLEERTTTEHATGVHENSTRHPQSHRPIASALSSWKKLWFLPQNSEKNIFNVHTNRQTPGISLLYIVTG
jgi:hypothetical protein